MKFRTSWGVSCDTIGDVVVHYVHDRPAYEDGVLESLDKKFEALTEVLAQVCHHLPPLQQELIAKQLGYTLREV